MKILLLSGGADSMLLFQTYPCDVTVFFDYGQQHLDKELSCCSDFVDEIIKLPPLTIRDKEVNCRNLCFIINLVSVFGYEDLEIYIGTNAEDVYKDNSRDFYNEVEDFINKISFYKVKVITPLKDMTKNEILKKLELTYYTD